VIALEQHQEGVVIPVRASAGARRTGLGGVHAGMLKVAVAAVPERGQANRAIVDVLCREFSLRSDQVALLTGASSRQKRFLVRYVTCEELTRRIEAALANAR
jgi:uncharacterized protein (TIGR00251 family)